MKYLLSILCLFSLIFSSKAFTELCDEKINNLNFNYPKINSKAISPNGRFILEINEDASITLKDSTLNQQKIISPPMDYGCGSIGCSTPEKRVLFTSNGQYAITSISYVGGDVKIWKVGDNIDSWIDKTDEIIMSRSSIGGFFRLSPDNNFIVMLEHSMKTGLFLHLLSLESFSQYNNIIGGWVVLENEEGEYELSEGLKFNGNSKWIDIYMKNESYSFNFTDDNKSIVSKINSNDYIIYDIQNHSLSSCTYNISDYTYTNQFDSLSQLIMKGLEEGRYKEYYYNENDYKNKLNNNIPSLEDKWLIINLFREFKNALKEDNKKIISDFIDYPLSIDVGDNIITIYDFEGLTNVYDDLFTDSVKEVIISSGISAKGRGIVCGLGEIWFNWDFKIMALNLDHLIIDK